VLDPVTALIEAELNVKHVSIRGSVDGIGSLGLKPNFAGLGSRVGQRMKELQRIVSGWDSRTAEEYRKTQSATVELEGGAITLGAGDLVIDIVPAPGYHCESDGRLIVGLDTRLTDDLVSEGFARELINRVQNTRKKSGLAVTDRIMLTVRSTSKVVSGIRGFADKIRDETLAVEFHVSDRPADDLEGEKVDLNGEPATIAITPRRV
jgi:isoleucyl-tRNA synthetase